MIDKSVYDLDYIRNLQSEYNCDPSLIERALYAFGLLEALRKTGMPFCFKGGTSLMLLLETPLRLSTDIDILVEPGTDVDKYISKASMIFPFLNKTEDIRKGRNRIVKRHFKFTYYSPLRNTEFYILLDVVFAHLPYAKTIRKEIRNNLLRTEGDNLSVDIPSPECLLGDKLTAFAPHTTGILLGSGCELEIAKQLFDSAVFPGVVPCFRQSSPQENPGRFGTWVPIDGRYRKGIQYHPQPQEKEAGFYTPPPEILIITGFIANKCRYTRQTIRRRALNHQLCGVFTPKDEIIAFSFRSPHKEREQL